MKILADELEKRRAGFSRLAKKSGLTEERLDELARGRDATLRELRVVAKALGLSVSDFAPAASGEATTEEGRVAMMFRGPMTLTTSATAATRPQSHEFHAEVFSRRVTRALSLLPSAKHELDWMRAFECRETTYLDAERNADLFRELFFRADMLSPLVTLPQILSEMLGVLLFVLGGEPVDGASAVIGGHAFIFLSPRTFLPRMLYTLGHELGHLVARARSTGDFAAVDRENSVGAFGTGTSALEESYCNAFSSCLLLPRAAVGSTLKMIREKIGIEGDLGDLELLLLAHAYGVSFDVAAKRCEDLGLLPAGGARSLYEELKKKHGSPEKRAAEESLPEALEISFPTVPPRLLDAAVHAVRGGEVSIGAAAGILNVSIAALLQANRPPVASA